MAEAPHENKLCMICGADDGDENLMQENNLSGREAVEINTLNAAQTLCYCLSYTGVMILNSKIKFTVMRTFISPTKHKKNNQVSSFVKSKMIIFHKFFIFVLRAPTLKTYGFHWFVTLQSLCSQVCVRARSSDTHEWSMIYRASGSGLAPLACAHTHTHTQYHLGTTPRTALPTQLLCFQLNCWTMHLHLQPIHILVFLP